MANQSISHADPFTFTLTAHSAPEGNLLLISALCEGEKSAADPGPMELAIVLDRSGSMSGQKLEIARLASAELIRSLRPSDRVAVVTYDSAVDVVSAPTSPNERLAAKVASIQPGGNTDLYGGWVVGAKLLRPGGRVLLLSDGQANAGRFTDAPTLSAHAGISFERYRTTTTTVGVGEDYDEAIMAGMAARGGGSHYFAHTAQAIRDAFSQERFSMGSVAAGFASLRVNGVTRQLGHFWAGETKRIVMPIGNLEGKATIRFTLHGETEPKTIELVLPREFGHSEEAVLEFMVEQAVQLEARALEVNDPQSAGRLKEEVRALLLKVMAHSLSDSQVGKSVVERLQASHDRLERLERRYDETEATMHRKRSMQASHNMRERAQAFSSFDEDAGMIVREYVATMTFDDRVAEAIDARALALAPAAKWKEWRAAPLALSNNVITVGMDRPKAMFEWSEIEKATRCKVNVQPMMPDVLTALLRTLRS